MAGLIKDPAHGVREAVVEALGLIKHISAVEPLILALTDTQASIRHAAAGVLRKLDPEWEQSEAARRTIPALKAALSSKEYWVRQAAADTLAKLSDMPKTEPSFNGFSDPVFYKRTAALQALLQAMGDWDRDIRLAAAEALARLADPRGLQALVKAQDDADQFVRHTAHQGVEKLSGLPQREAIELTPGREIATLSA